jgi:predicted kinase
MAGWMGSGKSSLARAISGQTGAVVLDHDTTKTAIMSAGVPHPPAGGASYAVVFALAADFLEQGLSVVIDSPCVYSDIAERGLHLAANAGVPYYFIECSCSEELSRQRLDERDSRASQVKIPADAAAVRNDPARRPHRPAGGALVLDTSESLSKSIDRAIAHLSTKGARGPVVSGPAPAP